MVRLKTEAELELMRKSGFISAKVLKKAIEMVKPGINLLDIEKVAMYEIVSLGGKPSFTTVLGYKWSTCLTVNEELVHGIPKDRVLNAGDLLSIDVGAVFKGWHTDTAWSVIVGGKPTKFLQIGEEALWKGIKQAIQGNTIGDISATIQETIEGAGYDVSRTLIGHGVGQDVHEPPDVPGFGQRGRGLILQSNMTLAIEAIYAEGSAAVYLDKDGWTYITNDHSLGGLFEMTVVVKDKKAEVLTDWRTV